MTVNVAADKLRRSLAAVLPAAAGDDTFELLNLVHVHASRGVLALTSTNRYVAVHAKCPAEEGDLECVVPLATLRLLAAQLRGLKPTAAPIRLSVTDDRFAADLGKLELRAPTGDLSGFPMKSLAKAFEPLPPQLNLDDAASFSLSPHVLGVVGKVLTAAQSGEETFWYRAELGKPILVEVADWLMVAVMPMRKSETPRERLTFGLPPASAKRAVKKAAPAKKTTRRRAA